MIDANRDATEETLRRLKEASYERFSIELIKSIEHLLEDFEMTWDDLAEKLQWKHWDRTLREFQSKGAIKTGEEVKKTIGESRISLFALNDIAHVFSMEPYILFKPRLPYTGS